MKNIDRLIALYRTEKPEATSDDIMAAFVLVKIIKETEEDRRIETGEEEPYSSARKLADIWKIRNPLEDKKTFFNVYTAFDAGITWQDILHRLDSKTNVQVPEALLHEFKRFLVKSTETHQTILIPEVEKFAGNLLELVDEYKRYSFVITTTNTLAYIIVKNLFARYDYVEAVQASIYDYEFMAKRFDIIFSVPSFGVRERAKENNPFICREYDLIAVENLALHLNSGGRLVIVLPARFNFAAGRVGELRNFMQSMYQLLEMGQLPAGIFPNSGIKTVLFAFSTGRTEEVVVKKYGADVKKLRRGKVKTLNVEDETFIFSDELAEMEDWDIDRIFAMQDEEWLRYEASKVKKVELGAVAEVFRGKTVNKKVENGGVGVVNISNLGEYEVSFEKLEYIEEEERKIGNYMLKDRDLLIPARGTLLRVAMFREQGYPCIASSNVIVIRARKELLNSTYLKIFLDSPLGNKILNAKQQGAMAINISYKDLKSMEIPLPPLKDQEELAEEYERELEVYQKTMEAAKVRWENTVVKLQGKI